jgi:hypothetical protein
MGIAKGKTETEKWRPIANGKKKTGDWGKTAGI